MTHVTFTLVSSSAICILLSKFSGLVMRKKPSFSIEFDIIGKMKQKMDMDQWRKIRIKARYELHEKRHIKTWIEWKRYDVPILAAYEAELGQHRGKGLDPRVDVVGVWWQFCGVEVAEVRWHGWGGLRLRFHGESEGERKGRKQHAWGRFSFLFFLNRIKIAVVFSRHYIKSIILKF